MRKMCAKNGKRCGLRRHGGSEEGEKAGANEMKYVNGEQKNYRQFTFFS